MGPLRSVAWGLLVVSVDLKIDQLDLVADPIGWTMVLFALLKLRELHPAFGLGVWAAGHPHDPGRGRARGGLRVVPGAALPVLAAGADGIRAVVALLTDPQRPDGS
jgi:hypothetical protein